jgi:hypothetical protein
MGFGFSAIDRITLGRYHDFGSKVHVDLFLSLVAFGGFSIAGFAQSLIPTGDD